MKAEFYIRGLPVPKGNHKAFIIRTKTGQQMTRITDKAGKVLVHWENAIAVEAEKFVETPVSNGVEVHLRFYLPRPKYHFTSKGTPSKQYTDTHTKKPDLDKLIRALFDALTGIVYLDDAQIYQIVCSKKFADEKNPVGVFVRVFDSEE